MRSVKLEAARILVVLAIMVGLAAWQWSFVINAISANPALNLVIISTFLFGLSLVGFAIRSLVHEYHALYAMMELYEDASAGGEAAKADPMWRYYRAARVGIVFKPPVVLGPAYRLITEQLRTTHQLNINATTMQALHDGLDERLASGRQLIGYVSGILVFLGLIGTFIGLMVTLASVGEILGALDLTAEDPTETIAALMTNLQTPLGGMATGFSSSLFGLLTSLTISVMMQLIGRAGGALRSEFDEWLTNAVQLNDTPDESSGAAQGAAIEERRLALLMRTARHLVKTSEDQRQTMDTLSDEVRTLRNDGAATRSALDKMADVTATLADQHALLGEATRQSAEATRQSAQATMTAARAATVRQDLAQLAKLLRKDLSARETRVVNTLLAIQDDLDRLSTEGIVAPRQSEQKTDQPKDDMTVSQLQRLLSVFYRRARKGAVEERQEDRKRTGS